MTFKKVCEECKKKFETPIFWRKYCSDACKQKAWRERKKKKVKNG